MKWMKNDIIKKMKGEKVAKQELFIEPVSQRVEIRDGKEVIIKVYAPQEKKKVRWRGRNYYFNIEDERAAAKRLSLQKRREIRKIDKLKGGC